VPSSYCVVSVDGMPTCAKVGPSLPNLPCDKGNPLLLQCFAGIDRCSATGKCIAKTPSLKGACACVWAYACGS
jgi:hypothetical protein